MTRLIDRINSRCVENGDCLLWTGRVSDAGLPIITVGHSTFSARKIAYERLHGEVPEGKVVSPTCGHKRCMAEAHLQALTPKKSKELASRRGAYSSPARSRKAALTLRAKSHITDEMVEAIRQASSAREAQALTGINLSYAYQIRNGTARREFIANPFSGLGTRP